MAKMRYTAETIIPSNGRESVWEEDMHVPSGGIGNASNTERNSAGRPSAA